MEEKKSYDISKGTILIILILFMFSSKIWDVTWDIGKSLLYIIAIVYFLNLVDKGLANKIKEIIVDFINIDSENNFFKEILSKISSTILNIFKSSTETKKIISEEEIKPVAEEVVRIPDNLKLEENRSLNIVGETNNRTLI